MKPNSTPAGNAGPNFPRLRHPTSSKTRVVRECPANERWRAIATFAALFTSWDSLLSQAAEFASSIGRERLITISHSEDENDGVVVVWYWADAEEKEMP